MSIDNFNKVMDEYIEKFTQAKNQEQQNAIDEKYNSIIDIAEKELEASLNKEIEELESSLKEEREAVEKELERLDEEVDTRIKEEQDSINSGLVELMKGDINTISQSKFTQKYKVVDVRILAESMGIETKDGKNNIKEEDLVSKIYEIHQGGSF